MARIAAKNCAILAGARDISGRLNSANLALSAESPEVTCFGAVNRERMQSGISDATLTMNGFYDASASMIDSVFSELLAASAMYGYYPGGKTASGKGKEIAGILLNYTMNGALADAAAVTATVSSCMPLLDAVILSASVHTATGASQGAASVDFGASTPGTVWAMMRVFAISGASPQISGSFQNSSDDSAWTTLVDFGAAASLGNIFVLGTVTSASRYRRFKFLGGAASGSISASVMVSCGSLMNA